MASEDEDDALTSFLLKFTPRNEDGLVTPLSKYPRAGHEQRKVNDCEYVDVEIDDVFFTMDSLQEALDLQ